MPLFLKHSNLEMVQLLGQSSIIGFSLNEGVVLKWTVNTHDYANILRQVYSMADLPVGGSSIHKDCSPSWIAQFEKSVQEVQETIAMWVDPFAEGTESDDSLNISSGVVAPPNVKKDLIRAHSVGGAEFDHYPHMSIKPVNWVTGLHRVGALWVKQTHR